jgi:nucleotide-binding universal stress UspA family protein
MPLRKSYFVGGISSLTQKGGYAMVMIKPKNILVPVDFSAQSETALKDAVELAKDSGAQVYVLHVIANNLVQCIDDYCLNDELIKQMGASRAAQSTDDYAVTLSMVKQIDELMIKKSQEMMTALINKIPGAKQVTIIPLVKKGIPCHEILDVQKKKAIDMIIIPPHGKSGIKEFFLGSTVDKVVRQAGCTVVVVK